MNNFLVCHIQKFKQADLVGMERHLDRSSINNKNKDIDASRTCLNYDVKDIRSHNCGLRQKVLDKIASRKSEKKLRKDAVVFCSCVVSASPEFFKDKTDEFTQSYFECAVDFLDRTFNSSNNVYAVVHMDEGCPHLHYGFCPLQNGDFCAKNIVNRNTLRKIQDEMPKWLQQHGFDVIRGIENSPLKHADTHEWKRSERILEAKKEDLMQKLDVKTKPERKFWGTSENIIVKSSDFNIVQEIAGQTLYLLQNNTELKRKQQAIQQLRRELEKQEEEIAQKVREQQKKADELLAKEMSLKLYKDTLESMDKDLELQKLLNDNREQQRLLNEKEKRLKESVLQTVEEEVRRQGKHGYWEARAMRELKSTDPKLYEMLIQRAKQADLRENQRKAWQERERNKEHTLTKK